LGAGGAHENIIQMLFSCTVGEEEFIVLEFFEGAYTHKLYLQPIISHAYYTSLDSSLTN